MSRVVRWLAPLLGIAALLGCTSHGSSVYGEVTATYDARPAIIFIPGFYGSALRAKHGGRRVFLTGMEALFGNEAMSLFQDQLGTPRGPDLEVEGVLGAVTVVPGLYEVDVYAPFLRRLRQLRPDAQVIPLAYDWREDLTLAVRHLDETVKELQARSCKSIALVSHSMGGQVAAYYLAYGSQPPESAKIDWSGARNVSRAIFFGTPFNGTMVTFRSFDKGSGLPHSEKLLSADTMSSFPSMYELLPGIGTLYDRKGSKSSVDLFDPELWHKYRFGLFRRDRLPASYVDQRAHFVSEWLAKAHRWSELLQIGNSAGWQPPAELKVLNIVSSHHPTLDAGYLEPGTGRLYFDPKDVTAAGLKTDPLFSDGDGTVTMASAAIPAALEGVTKQVVVEGPHESLFLDPAADKEYKDFLENKSSR